MRALAALVLAPALAFGAAAGAVGIVGGITIPVSKPTSVVWSGRVFSSREDLAGWLRAKGGTYEAWAKRHPTAASVLGDRTRASGARASYTSSTRPNPLFALLVTAAAVLAVMAVFVQLGGSRKAHISSGRARLPVRGGFDSAVRLGIASVSATREMASSPQGRRMIGRYALYAASAVLTMGLGAAIALYLV